MPQAIEVFNPKITEVGRAAAISQSGSGLRVKITHVSLGSGRSDTDATGAAATDLISRVETVTIAGGSAGPDSFRVSVLFGAAATPYTATEVGFWMGDPAAGGKLFAIWSTTDPLRTISQRSRGQYVMAFGMALSGIPAGSIEVTVDPGAAVALALIGSHEGATDPHPQYATKAALQVQKHTAGSTAGDGTAYTLAVTPPIEALQPFTRVHCQFHAAATADMPTLNVSGTGARPLQCYSQTGQKVAAPARAIAAGMLADVVYDGQDWILLTRLPTSTTPAVDAASATSSPAFGGGTGTESDPYIIAPSIGAPGAQGVKLATLTIPGLPAGDFMPVADLNESANGGRYTATNRVVGGSGALVFDLMFSDSPVSAIGATRDLLMKVGDLFIKHRRTITNATVTLAPTITSPANGATASGITPSFTTSAYATSGGADTHKATDWEVATTADFGPSIVFASTGDTTNLTAWTIPAALAYGATYYVRARHKGATSGASTDSPTIAFTTPVQVTTVRPSITTPSASATGVSLTPTITSGPLQVSSGAATHLSSSWDVATDAGFLNIVSGTRDNTNDLTAWVPGVALSNDTTYYARVKHVSVSGGASGWSDSVSFRTVAAAAITRPAITTPTTGATGFTGALASSAFAVTNGSDAHASSSWQVSTDPEFPNTAIVSTVWASATAKTQWTPTGLQPGATYYARVLHMGLSLPTSQWSAAVTFTAMAVTTPTAPAIGSGSAVLPGATVTGAVFGATGTDPHHDTDWELSTSPTFSPLSGSSSLADTVNLTAWAIPAGLTPATTYYLRARYRSASGVVSTYSSATSFTTSAMATTNTPALTAPAAGALATNPPTLTTSAFGVSTGTDTHQMTTWQIARDAAFTDIAASSIGDTANLITWAPSAALAAGGTYYLRARHKAAAAGWSAYSATVTVQAAAAPQTAVTSILTPTADQIGFAGEVTTAPFALTSGTGVHSSTDWQIAADDTFAAVLYASMNDAVNKTSFPTAGISELTPGGYYYVRSRHRDATFGAAVQYSAPVRFRRMKTLKPTITSPSGGATGVALNHELTSSAFASDGVDSHSNSEWVVSASPSFSPAILEHTGAQSLTALPLSGASSSGTYYAKVRHVGLYGGTSDWSATISFTTAGEFGTAWTQKTFSASTGRLYCCAAANGVIVVGGYAAMGGGGAAPVSYSTDGGANFLPAVGIPASGATGANYANSLIFVNGKFFATITPLSIYSSVDGINWVLVNSMARVGRLITDGVLILGGYSGTTYAIKYSSDFGGSFTDTWTPSGVCGGICYAADIDLFVVNLGGNFYTCSDGISFRIGSSSGSPVTAMRDGVYRGGGVFLAMSSGGLLRSINGVDWVVVASSAIGSNRPSCAHYMNGSWYLVVNQGVSGYLLRSVDGGLTWANIFAFDAMGIAYGFADHNGKLFCVGASIIRTPTTVTNGDGTTTTTYADTYYPALAYCAP
ncbi:MAG: hypothetical protein RLZZ373_3186 [Pseudomonadota bacterium]|jgi:hypothetical protein